MKVSVNWLKQFTDIDLSVDELAAKIGEQLGAVEEIIDLGKKYQGIIVAKVVSCEKHPNADKLSVCWIDDGGKAEGVARNEAGHVQVVCGAPNVRAGLTVAWLPPGATVPSTSDKDPFVLEARELRGIVSNGMLASSQELAIGDDHSGIVEIDIDAEPGADFADLYELNDSIIDIENKMFTHRPDCFGILGVAREVAGIQGKKFESPDWYKSPLDRIKPGKSALPLTIKNETLALVPRFMAVAMADVTIKPSPLIIQTYLARVGLRPINNVVDVTNYLMVLSGQPTHAYDYDKLNGASIETRMSRRGDKLKLLNGKELEFDDDSTVLITSGDIPVGVGGVMGGADTEVSETTKNIVIECANFDMYSIRRASMKYGLFTDAVTRFNKGQSPLQNDVILEETVATMQYVSGAHVASDVSDVKIELQPHKAVEVSTEFINVRLGAAMATEDIARLLENVEFSVEVHGDILHVTPPYWRTDIKIAEDVVEEAGRLHGFNNLSVELPARSIAAAERSGRYDFKRRIRDIMSKAGASEILSYSFVHGNLLKKSGQDPEKAFRLSNAISPDLQYYRLSMLPSLLEKIRPNGKAGFETFALFEMNKSHTKDHADDDDGVPKEFENLAFVVTASDKVKPEGAAFYQARAYLDALAAELGLNFSYEAVSDQPPLQATRPFELQRAAKVYIAGTDIVLGMVGEFSDSVRQGFKLPVFTAGFELAISRLHEAAQNQRPSTYIAQPRFPKVQQDITLKVTAQTKAGDMQAKMLESLKKTIKPDTYYFTLQLRDIYEKGDAKHLTFRLVIAHYQKTLTDGEVNELLNKLAEASGAERI